MKTKTNPNQIRGWMRANAHRFADRKTGEINLTELVEAWDQEFGNGETTDPDHIAWAIALEVAR